MTHYIRYFIFTISSFLSITGYAVEPIIRSTTNNEMPTQTQDDQTYQSIQSPRITWPGYNSAMAQVDNTENGFGSFTANATDSSNHPVTYLFEVIAGPGTVKGSQTGSFSLSGVNGSTVVRITATADDAAPVVGAAITVQVSTVPIKVLAFYNNTSETIYPVIEAPISGVVPSVALPRDPWMQGLFAVTDVNKFRFQATKLHRVYVNGTNGIPPKQTALVSVPFYSHLVPNPSGGDIADHYVDWWSSMRVYLYDVQSNLVQTQSEPGVSPVTLYSPGPTCISGCSQTEVFSATGIMPTNDPQQLTEYTFADVITAASVPYPINLSIVNYDYSAVDQVYLPVAMEPYGSNLVGYTGTVLDLTSFRNSLDTFLAETSWPAYAGLPYPRAPGAYNVVIGNSQLTPTGPQTTELTNNWIDCLANVSNPNHANCLTVNNLFVVKNYQNACDNEGLPTTAELLQHIYGYVSFCATPLPSSGFDFDAYSALQYNFVGYAQDFNPYTQLIHRALRMNVYAYSVDDAVGFIRTTGNGLVVTVGGDIGLTNPQQYDKQKVITVSPGTPPPGPLPIFTHYGVCSKTASSGQLGRGESFSLQLPNSSFPCEITLEDSNHILYHFTLNEPAPLTSTAADISCAAADNSWCSGVQITSAQGISTSAPNP
ncbi:hypothetical protein OQJ19_13970 [Fluoribacter gormanii]|uniref:hypothetical protein n=1 Tax=Fluoribacter gormanii TaxID=464 RepID=UPI002244BCF2|nr:hypothetical protein [Fluoribacter gormanii]MCW8471744.1 hypothetical protein [Fluoribacter gormanii]